MLRLLSLVALGAFVLGCAQAPSIYDFESGPDSIVAAVEYDVVRLIETGEEVRGSQMLTVKHGAFEYRFAGKASMQAFLKNRDRYAVQLGGGCGRMGALSGPGSPKLYAIHEDRLYFFASEGCRSGFLEGPSKILEPVMDQPITAGTNEALLAHELLRTSLAFLGGAENVDGTQLDWSFAGDQVSHGVTYQVNRRELVGPADRYRTVMAWNDQQSVNDFAQGEGYLASTSTGRRTADFSQLRAMERKLQVHLLPLYQQRDSEHTYLCAEPSDVPGVDILHLSVQGFSHRIGVERESGKIVWHEYGGFGPDMTFGTVRDTFRNWERQQGLMIPIWWERSFNGEAQEDVHRGDEGWRVKVRRGSAVE